MNLADLPQPSTESAARSATLRRKIGEQITAADGAIAFSQFMDLALYAPELGYYATGRHILGRTGDFITASELGSLYARTVARALAPVLKTLNHPEVLEVGPGSGLFAADFLTALRGHGVPLERYGLLETSNTLRERQVETLEKRARETLPRVVWLEEAPTVGWEGVVIANEVFDALPVDIVVQRDQLMERRVGLDAEGEFCWTEVPISAHLSTLIDALPHSLHPGQIVECCTGAPTLLDQLSRKMLRGVVYLNDYGMSAAELITPERGRGTLIAHYRQRRHEDPFWYPGLNDLTHSVNFSQIARAATTLGLDVACYTSQSDFLLQGGLPAESGDMSTLGERARLQLAQQIKMLTLPDQMGERFKVMAMARNLEPEQLGPAFARHGQLHRL